MKDWSEERQQGVNISVGRRARYTAVNFHNVEKEGGYEYDTVTFTTDKPFTKDNYDVIGMVVDAVLADGDILPVSVMTELVSYLDVEEDAEETINAARKLLETNVAAYDVSPNVNAFFIGEQEMWLDKATRVSLMSTLQIGKAAGMTETTFWWDAVPYTFPVAQFEQMLSALELYAKGCYDRTQSHLAAAKEMTKLSDMCEYDYTTGYPDKLSF